MSATDARDIEPVAPRLLPELNELNRPYWTGGSDGQLLIWRCDACDRWVHPPVATCPACSGPLEARPVSGRGTVFTFTINEQMFNPEVTPPYNIAIVVLDEQDDLRLPTNIVGCEVGDIEIGMPVKVAFEHAGDHFVPLFEPA